MLYNADERSHAYRGTIIRVLGTRVLAWNVGRINEFTTHRMNDVTGIIIICVLCYRLQYSLYL